MTEVNPDYSDVPRQHRWPLEPDPQVGSTRWLQREATWLIGYAENERRRGAGTVEEELLNLQRAGAYASLAASYATVAEMQSREIDRIAR